MPLLLLHSTRNKYSQAIAGANTIMLSKVSGAATAPNLVSGLLHALHTDATHARHGISSEASCCRPIESCKESQGWANKCVCCRHSSTGMRLMWRWLSRLSHENESAKTSFSCFIWTAIELRKLAHPRSPAAVLWSCPEQRWPRKPWRQLRRETEPCQPSCESANAHLSSYRLAVDRQLALSSGISGPTRYTCEAWVHRSGRSIGFTPTILTHSAAWRDGPLIPRDVVTPPCYCP